jgi:hypothetical protein
MMKELLKSARITTIEKLVNLTKNVSSFIGSYRLTWTLQRIIARITIVQAVMELRLPSANRSRVKKLVKLTPNVYSFSGKNQEPIKAVHTIWNGTEIITSLKPVNFLLTETCVIIIPIANSMGNSVRIQLLLNQQRNFASSPSTSNQKI